MFRNTNFLKEDLEKAKKLYRKLMTEICKVEISLFEDKLNESASVAIQFANTAKELQRLRDKKLRHDSVEELVIQLKEKGMDIRWAREA